MARVLDFSVRFQPIVGAESGRIAGAELAAFVLPAVCQLRQIRFADLADDPQLCYAYISAHAQ